jgi:hypothetical protein
VSSRIAVVVTSNLNKRTRGLALFVALTSILLVVPGPSSMSMASSYNCASYRDGGSAGYHGYVRPPSSWHETPEGVYSDVLARTPSMCATDGSATNFSTTWVMIYDQTPSMTRYMQTGFRRNAGGCLQSWAEWNDGYGLTDVYDSGCVSDGSYVSYQVAFIGAPGPYPAPSPSNRFAAYAGYTVLGLTATDPWANGWSFTPGLFGESYYAASDIPGTPSVPSYLLHMQIKSVDTGTWTAIPAYLDAYHQRPNYCYWSLDSQDVYVYTDPWQPALSNGSLEASCEIATHGYLVGSCIDCACHRLWLLQSPFHAKFLFLVAKCWSHDRERDAAKLSPGVC